MTTPLRFPLLAFACLAVSAFAAETKPRRIPSYGAQGRAPLRPNRFQSAEAAPAGRHAWRSRPPFLFPLDAGHLIQLFDLNIAQRAVEDHRARDKTCKTFDGLADGNAAEDNCLRNATPNRRDR